MQARAERAKKPNAVYPLGESSALPGVTRRGRLECRDKASGAWLQTHVILTHLSLLVFQPLDEKLGGGGAGGPKAGERPSPVAGPLAALGAVVRGASAELPLPGGASSSTSPGAGSASSPKSTAAHALAATASMPNAHPSAAGLEMGVNSSLGGGEASSGRLLHNLHVTDILSILRHGDSESFAPPIHHRCFTIGDLNDVSVCFRAVNARDCLGWLKAIARAKDRALAAVHRLDDRAHGHDLVRAGVGKGGGCGLTRGSREASLPRGCPHPLKREVPHSRYRVGTRESSSLVFQVSRREWTLFSLLTEF